MYLALRGSSVIHLGTVYDGGPLLTTGEIIPLCKVQHSAKLFVDHKQTVPITSLCLGSIVDGMKANND